VENTIASLYNHFGETPPDHRKSSSSSSSCRMAQNKGNKRKNITYEDSLFSFTTLLSSRCIFSKGNLFEDGTKSTWRLYDTEQLGELYYKVGMTQEGGGNPWEIAY